MHRGSYLVKERTIGAILRHFGQSSITKEQLEYLGYPVELTAKGSLVSPKKGWKDFKVVTSLDKVIKDGKFHYKGKALKKKLKRDEKNDFTKPTKEKMAQHKKLYVSVEHKAPLTYPDGRRLSSQDFYDTREWKTLRYAAIELYSGKCMACGANPRYSDNVVLHVDHVKSRSEHPKLELSISNLQILCADCNLGKSNIYPTDWRRRGQKINQECRYPSKKKSPKGKRI
jgi:hypothetical protein